MKGKLSRSSSLQPKPPVVVILGHVNHGKTTLLDHIRKTNIVAKEAGGITQKIGAYQVKVPREAGSSSTGKSQSASGRTKLKAITFIDTPGHEAFSQMRNRGTKVADLAVLVVAADDGVMPQTKESIKYIKKAKIPFLVAINKIDLPSASVEKVYGQLAESGLIVETYGGKIVSVPVSAKTGKGVDKLLEMILLLAEMEEFKANPKGKFQGVIIESKLDHRKGPLATIIVQDGTLKIGDEIEIEDLVTKIKAMFDENGRRISQAKPAVPAEILGLKEVPPVGAKVHSVSPIASKPSACPDEPSRRNVGAGSGAPSVIKEVSEKRTAPEGTDRLKIILKTDTIGSLEAILGNFSDDVLVIHSEVGDISQSDVDLAKTAEAQIFAFNVKIPTEIKKLAQIEKVKVYQYKIIYELLEEIEKQVLKILEPTIDEEILGKAEIIAEFEIRGTRIAGAKVIKGKILKTEKIHLMRDEEIIGDTKITSMRHEKEDIIEAKTGQEFGATFSPSLDFQIEDVIISYK